MACHCRERSDHSQHSNHLGTSEIRHASDRRIHYSLRTEFPDGHFQDRLHQIHHGVSFRTIYQRSDIQGSYRVMSCIRHILFHETLSSRISSFLLESVLSCLLTILIIYSIGTSASEKQIIRNAIKSKLHLTTHPHKENGYDNIEE